MAKADIKDSIEETTPVMDDETMLSSITRACKTLTQAPSIVTKSLGHLLLISAGQDFSLKERCPNAKFEYIRIPDSFRACLVQISNRVGLAFDATHRSMNRISVKSEHIAMDAKAALELMEKGTHQEWIIALHRLQNAEESCQECVETAKSITEEFKEVSKVIDELYEALIASRGKIEDDEKSTRSKSEEARKEMERITESEKDLDERWDEAKKEYEDASPSPWKTVLFKFIDSVAHLAINLAVESLKEAVGSQMQVSTPNLELGKHGRPFTEALNKGEHEERKREKKVKYDECTTNRSKVKELKESVSKDHEILNQKINDLNNIKEGQKDSMQKLCMVTSFWRKLNIMFQTFHDLIKERIKENVGKALECGKTAKAIRDGQEMPEITREQIIVDSRNAMHVAFRLKYISRFYVDVSNKYLLVGVDSLQSMIVLETTSDHARMKELWRKLEEDAKEAERGNPIIAEEREKDLRNELSQHQLYARFR